MAVYVDKERNAFGRMIMCHMWADTADELHAMAIRIGMRREWFQTPGGPSLRGLGQARVSFPHYDVSLSRRAVAVKNGAIECDRREGVEVRRRIRQRIIEDADFAATWRY